MFTAQSVILFIMTFMISFNIAGLIGVMLLGLMHTLWIGRIRGLLAVVLGMASAAWTK